MDLNEISNILLASLAPATQKQSEEALKRAEQTNFPEYLRALSAVLCDGSKPPMACRTAGVLLKNYFYDSRSESGLKRKYQAWNTLVPEPVRQFIRECVLRALVSPLEDARKSAAQVLGALGVLELSERRWPEMIGILYNNATSPEMPDEIKVHTLEAMGFLCENLAPEYVSEALTNNLLTAIVENMKPTRNPITRLAAVRALYNTLAFAAANMNRENERNYIVTNICECARADKENIRCGAFDCMVRLAEYYYHLLNVPYMDAFFGLTVAAVEATGSAPVNSAKFKELEKVALHALELWCVLCEKELELGEEADHARSNGLQLDPTQVSHQFINKALQPLVNLVTTYCLTKQSPELNDDEDDWTLAMSGGTLLGLLAQCEPDNILRVVMPFVQANLPLMGQETWRQREAGLVAFGKCLCGPESNQVAPFIREGMNFFLALLDPAKESSPHVRDSATWVIGEVCQFHVETIYEHLPRIVVALVAVLEDRVPIVAAKSAQAIMHLAHSFRGESEAHTNRLSPFLGPLLTRLMVTAARPDWDEGELRGDCFEAMDAVVESCAMDGFPMLIDLLNEIIRKLNMAVNTTVTTSSQREELQGMIQNCCGTMLVITQRLKTQTSSHADAMMELLIRIMENVHHGAVLMDAHLVVGAIASALGMGFKKYYKAIVPFILRSLEASDDYQTCQTATELVSDVSRALGDKIIEESPRYVELMLKNLANEDLHRSVKPTTFSAMADVALALGPKFEYFADPVLTTLDAASGFTVQRDDPDMVEYLNEIRDSVMEAYTAIVQALKGPAAQRFFFPRAERILTFLATVCRESLLNEEDVSEDVIKSAVGLLGDMASLGPEVRYKVQSVFPQAYKATVEMCIASEDDEMQSVGNYFMKVMNPK